MVTQISNHGAISHVTAPALKSQTQRLIPEPDLGAKIVSLAGRGKDKQEVASRLMLGVFLKLNMTENDLFNHAKSTQAREKLKGYLFIDDSGVDRIKALFRSSGSEDQALYRELTTIRHERLSKMREE